MIVTFLSAASVFQNRADIVEIAGHDAPLIGGVHGAAQGLFPPLVFHGGDGAAHGAVGSAEEGRVVGGAGPALLSAVMTAWLFRGRRDTALVCPGGRRPFLPACGIVFGHKAFFGPGGGAALPVPGRPAAARLAALFRLVEVLHVVPVGKTDGAVITARNEAHGFEIGQTLVDDAAPAAQDGADMAARQGRRRRQADGSALVQGRRRIAEEAPQQEIGLAAALPEHGHDPHIAEQSDFRLDPQELLHGSPSFLLTALLYT